MTAPNSRGTFAALCWILPWAAFLHPAAAWGQSVEYTSADVYSIVVPTTCPLILKGGIPGMLFGIPYAGHQWTAAWDRGEVLSLGYDRARYRPHAYDGYASYNKGSYIVSFDAEARWYKPSMDVKCTAVDHYLFGHWIGRDEDFIPYKYYGSVEECTSGGATGSMQLIDDNGYDIYNPDYSASCSDSGEESGGGSGSGSGIPYGPGDSTGGETVDWGTGVGNGGSSGCGVAAVVQFVCIDVMTASGWQEWGCGYVTTC